MLSFSDALRAAVAAACLCGGALAAPPAGVRAFGAARPQQFLQDAIAGRSSVDLLMIGDSNIGYDGGAYQRGFAGGFVDALLEAGADMYATAICTAASDVPQDQIFPPFGGIGGGVMYQAAIGVGAPPTTPWNFARGSAALPAEAQPFYGIPVDGPALRATATRTDWLYFASPVISSPPLDDWLFLAKTAVPHQLSAGMAVTFRVGVVRFPGSNGYLQPSVHRDDDRTVLVGPFRFAARTDAATAEVASAELALPADAARGSIVGMHGAYPMLGPVGVLFRSFYRHGPGFAVTPVAFNAGDGTAQIAGAVSAAKLGMIRSYLREARERQLAAGGPGRVLVFTNSGVNGDDGDTWVVSSRTIQSAVREAWDSLGYPRADLAFLISVSAPIADADSMSSLRARGRAAATGTVDAAFMDLGAAGPFLHALGLWDARGPYHLTADGYHLLAKEMLAAPRANPADLVPDGIVNGTDVGFMLGAWGTPAADLNGDGNTDAQDLGQLLGQWGVTN